MMYVRDGNCIVLTRGDSAYINVTLTTIKGKIYELTDGDTIKFTVKQSIYDKTPIIEKTSTTNVIHLEPSDTSELDFGDYFYDVQLDTAGGDTFTVVRRATFTVDVEVG